jgi:hypothetical protein
LVLLGILEQDVASVIPLALLFIHLDEFVWVNGNLMSLGA